LLLLLQPQVCSGDNLVKAIVTRSSRHVRQHSTVPVHTVIGDAQQLQNNTLTTTKMRLLQQQQKQLSQDFFV
jgi:hypothetical protein